MDRNGDDHQLSQPDEKWLGYPEHPEQVTFFRRFFWGRCWMNAAFMQWKSQWKVPQRQVSSRQLNGFCPFGCSARIWCAGSRITRLCRLCLGLVLLPCPLGSLGERWVGMLLKLKWFNIQHYFTHKMYQHETWGKLGWLICSKLGCFFPSCAAHVLQCLRVCGCTSCCVVECETVGEGRPRDFNRSEILRLKFVKLKFQDYLILRIFTIYWPFFKSGLASHFLSPWCPWLPGGLCWCFGILWGLSPLIPNKVTPCHTMSHHQSWLIFEPDFLCLRFLMFFWCFLGCILWNPVPFQRVLYLGRCQDRGESGNCWTMPCSAWQWVAGTQIFLSFWWHDACGLKMP